MNNEKFKIGDNVRIIDCSAIEAYELNKIGTIVDIRNNEWDNFTSYVVDMGRPRRPGNNEIDEDTETCWYLQKHHIELARKPNEQLLFDFMNK